MKTIATLNVRSKDQQRGVTVLFAMLALVALSFAAAGLVRSTSSNALVIGNLALKADTAAFTDRGTEAAIAWVNANAATLDNDNPAAGYYATALLNLDPTGQRVFNAPPPSMSLGPMGPTAPPVSAVQTRELVDWKGDACASSSGSFTNCVLPSPEITGANGNTYRYVVMRLCSDAGGVTATGQSCATSLNAVAAIDRSRDAYDYQRSMTATPVAVQQPSYRIVVRAAGARNAVTYTEAVIRR
jgi:type IV pilus assembly protein PilX